MKRLSSIVAVLALLVGCSSGSETRTPENSQIPPATGQSGPVAEQQVAPDTPEVLALDQAAQADFTPDTALERLKAGNQRFLAGERENRNLLNQVRATSGGQFPLAVVLSCIDSRVPAEAVFDQGVGDIFVARVAGNYATDDMLGSIEFGTKVAGAKLVVVMGHTSCGAVKGSCDSVDLGHVTAIVNEIRPSVEAVVPKGQTCSSKNEELVNDIAVHNVARTIEEIREESTILAEMERAGTIKIVGAMYDVSTGAVLFL